MALRWYLQERCHERGITAPEQLWGLLEQLPGVRGRLGRDTVQRWWSVRYITPQGKGGIEWETLECFCAALNLQPGELLAREAPRLIDFLRTVGGGSVRIAVGARPGLVLGPGEAQLPVVHVEPGKYNPALISMWDLHAVTAITVHCPLRPQLVETPCTLPYASWATIPEASVAPLRLPGVLVGLGSPLVSGAADWFLLQMQQAGLTPRPFCFVWDFDVQALRWYHRFAGPPPNSQGIEWEDQLCIPIPSWAEIARYAPGTLYDDGCIIVVWRTNRRQTVFVGVCGFMGPGTAGGAAWMGSEDFGERLVQYQADWATRAGTLDTVPEPPRCIALRVRCQKTGPGRRDVDLVQEGGAVQVQVVKEC